MRLQKYFFSSLFTSLCNCEITITFLNLILDLKCFFNIPAEESIVYHTQTWLHVACFFSILFSTETEGAPGFSFLKESLLVACSMLLVLRSLLSPELLVHSPFSQQRNLKGKSLKVKRFELCLYEQKKNQRISLPWIKFEEILN